MCSFRFPAHCRAREEPLRELFVVNFAKVARDVLFSDNAIAAAMNHMGEWTHALYPSLVPRLG